MSVRYAIRFTTPDGVIFHMQGLPKLQDGDDGFQFAVLYATHKHAVDATRAWKLRTAIEAMKRQGTVVHIVEVKCEFGEEFTV